MPWSWPKAGKSLIDGSTHLADANVVLVQLGWALGCILL
jgi:hypothetical protein